MFSIPKITRDRKQKRKDAAEYRRTELIQKLYHERDDALFMAKIRQSRIDSLEEQLRFAKAHVERMRKLTKKVADQPKHSVQLEIHDSSDGVGGWYQGTAAISYCAEGHVVTVHVPCDCE